MGPATHRRVLLLGVSLLLSFAFFLPVRGQAAGDGWGMTVLGVTLGANKEETLALFEAKKISLLSDDGKTVRFAAPLVPLNQAGETILEWDDKGKLFRIETRFVLPSLRFSGFKEHYDKLTAILREKYGRPTVRRELISPSFNGNLSATALDGELGYGAIYAHDGVRITLQVHAETKMSPLVYLLEYGVATALDEKGSSNKQLENAL